MKLFSLHFAIGLRAITVIVLLLALFALPLVALAQDESPAAPELATLGLPTVLTTLVGVNYGLTNWFKRMLGSTYFGGVPPKDVQSVLVIAFSMALGVGMVYGTPDATNWVLEQFPNTNIILANVLTGLLVSTLGGFVADIWKRVKPASVSGGAG